MSFCKNLLMNCTFCEENDIDYLKDDQYWTKSKVEKIAAEEKAALDDLVCRLHGMEKEVINVRFVSKLLIDCFDKAYLKQLSSDKRKQEVKAIFIAAVVRELILRDQESEEERMRRTSFLSRFPFLLQGEGSNLELTYLNRYERALSYIMKIGLPAAGNKQLYMNIGAQLEGSSVFTEYITGGSNRPETQHRVDIFVDLTKIQPKKRNGNGKSCLNRITARKRSCSSFSPERNTTPTTRGRGRPRKFYSPPSPSLKFQSTKEPNIFVFERIEEKEDKTQPVADHSYESIVCCSDDQNYCGSSSSSDNDDGIGDIDFELFDNLSEVFY
jgi:hypothetical protein